MSVVEAADTVTVERARARVPRRRLSPRLPGALGLHRRLGSDTSSPGRGLFPKITLVLCFLHAILKMKKHCAGQVRHQVLDRALAGLSGSDHTAVFAAPAARGRVDAVAPQRAGGHDGVEEVSPSDRLHSGLGWSAGPPHLQCG